VGLLLSAGLRERVQPRAIVSRIVRRARYDCVRLYESIRTAHLERAHEQVPATIVFRTRRYDFDAGLAQGLDLVPGGALSMAVTLARSRVSVLEVNEPLMQSGLARSALAVLTVRAAAAVRRRPVRVVSYAIENRDPFTGPPPGGRLRSRVRRWAEVRASRFVAGRLDRLAFGTADAQALYESVLGHRLAGTATRLVPALPAPCGCTAADREPDEVLFLGALDERKGVPLLLAAWPHVVRAHPSARITVVGKGPLEPAVRELAGADDRVRLVVDPPRPEVHAALRRVAVLVLLSQPRPTWREQVGLPLVEALAHGVAVVATEETGLRSWLSEHGHTVLPPGASPAEVAAALAGALVAGRSTASVLADLPAVDGRLAADRWLTGD
jgi:glycosyltransferase involved in cell wall biosynthesis